MKSKIEKESNTVTIHEFLADVKSQSETGKLKSLRPLLKSHNLHDSVGTVIRIVQIITDDDGIKWNPETVVSNELAVYVEKETVLYGRWNNQIPILDNLQKSSEQYPFDFDNLWEMLGYSKRNNAKASLENLCIINEDYYVLANQQINKVFPEKRTDFEVIKISNSGFLKLLWSAKTPVAKDRALFLQLKFQQMRQENLILKLDKLSSNSHQYLYIYLKSKLADLKRMHEKLATYIGNQNLTSADLLLNQTAFPFNNLLSHNELFTHFVNEMLIDLNNQNYLPTENKQIVNIKAIT